MHWFILGILGLPQLCASRSPSQNLEGLFWAMKTKYRMASCMCCQVNAPSSPFSFFLLCETVEKHMHSSSAAQLII